MANSSFESTGPVALYQDVRAIARRHATAVSVGRGSILFSLPCSNYLTEFVSWDAKVFTKATACLCRLSRDPHALTLVHRAELGTSHSMPHVCAS